MTFIWNPLGLPPSFSLRRIGGIVPAVAALFMHSTFSYLLLFISSGMCSRALHHIVIVRLAPVLLVNIFVPRFCFFVLRTRAHLWLHLGTSISQSHSGCSGAGVRMLGVLCKDINRAVEGLDRVGQIWLWKCIYVIDYDGFEIMGLMRWVEEFGELRRWKPGCLFSNAWWL